jgi:predicted MFS family arabinose efflux permease
VTFLAIGAGGLAGCLAGGYLADRIGRTMAAMAVSGACAVAVGAMFGANPVLLSLVCVLWGVAVIADSAQFSAAIAELAEP